MIIEVTRPTSDLARQRWTFFAYLRDSYSFTLVLRLDSYATEARESKRHRKWLASERWSSQRDPWSTDRAPGFKSLPKPTTIPDDVLAEVRQRAMECVQIEVMP
jgi:hypothetical protein